MIAHTERDETPYFKSSQLKYNHDEAQDIYEIYLDHANKETMKDFFQLIGHLYYATPTSGTMRVMIIQTGPSLPLNMFMNDIRAMISRHRHIPKSFPARFAVVLELSPFLQIIKQLLRLMRHQDAITFFDQGEEEKARAWLQA